MSASTGADRNRGRVVFAIVLGAVAIAFLAAGIIFCVEPAGSLTGWLAWLGHETVTVNGRQQPSPSYHVLRAVGSLIAGVVFAIGAWFTLKYQPATAGTSPQADKGAGTGVPSAR